MRVVLLRQHSCTGDPALKLAQLLRILLIEGFLYPQLSNDSQRSHGRRCPEQIRSHPLLRHAQLPLGKNATIVDASRKSRRTSFIRFLASQTPLREVILCGVRLGHAHLDHLALNG